MSSSFKRRLMKPCASTHGSRWAALAVAGVVSAIAPPSFAADKPVAAPSDSLEEIVVTAQFRSEKLQEVPIAITALSADAMNARNMTTLLDVANVAPNVTMFENTAAFGKTNAAFIRGIGQGDFNLAAGEPGVGIYIDDVYFATTLGSVFDLFDLDRVEILRGPQGTLFGKNSIGGAVRMISKKPDGAGEGYIDATLGNYSRRDFRAAYDMSLIPDRLFLRVSVMSKNRRGFVDRLAYACVNPQPAAGSGATVDSRGYTVNTNAPQYLGVSPGTVSAANGNCTTGTEGGEDVHGARAQFRLLISDKMENNFSAYVVDDNSEAAPEVALVADPTISPNLTNYNIGYMLPTYGVAYDQRFLTHSLYKTYSSFYDLVNNQSIPPVSSLHQWGVTNSFEMDVTDKMHFKSITGYLGYWTDWSDDQDNSPLPIAYAYNLVDHQQFTQEFQLTGHAWNNKVDWATGAFYYDGKSVNRGDINLQFFAGLAGFPPGFFGLHPIPGVPAWNFNNGSAIFPGNFLAIENFAQNSPATNKNEGVFLQGTEHLTDQFSLTNGVRYTHEKKEYTYQSFFGRLGPYDESYSHVDWKVSGDYKLTPDVLTYVSVSTGFRGGGFNPRPFNALQINKFQPEKLTEYEAGIKSDWFEHKLRANVAVFWGDYKNLQLNSQTTDSTGTPYTGIQNIGGANIKGAELEVEARPVGGLSMTASVGYTDFKYKDLGNAVACTSVAHPIPAPAVNANCTPGNPSYSDRPAGQPKLKANVGLAYEFLIPGSGSVTPRLDATYQDTVYADVVNQTPGAIIPGRTLLNGRLQWEAADGKWSVAALGTNLANKQYLVSIFDLRAFGEGQESGQPGRPREWAVNLKYKFQ